MANDYSIWSCCFARGELPADFMGGSPVDSNQGTIETPMLYTLIVSAPADGPRRVVLVDTGFRDGVSMTGRPFDNFEVPTTVLAKIGFAPSDVDLVVLTHLHFDHAGNFDAFPNASVVVQRREYEQWCGVLDATDRSRGKQSWPFSSLDAAVFPRLERAISGGKVRLLDGDAEIAPGVTCRLAADSHTFGSQWVEVATSDGRYVVAGDCVYRYVNLERMWPPAYIQGNPWNMLAAFRRMLATVDDHVDRILPGHDLEIFRRYPSWTNGMNPIAEIRLAPGERSRCPQELDDRTI